MPLPIRSACSRTSRRRGWITTLALVLTAGACSPTVSTHGHRLDDEMLAQLEPGRTSRDQVVSLLGSPSSRSTFDDGSWYYVSRRTERKSFYQEDVVDQQVVTITFDQSGVVEAVERGALEDARRIQPVARETPTEGNELSLLEQFIGNVGRFNLPETGAER